MIQEQNLRYFLNDGDSVIIRDPNGKFFGATYFTGNLPGLNFGYVRFRNGRKALTSAVQVCGTPSQILEDVLNWND